MYYLDGEKDLRISSGGINVRYCFDIDKLKKYPDKTKYLTYANDILQYMTCILFNQPVPTTDDIKRGVSSKWCKDLKREFAKYLKSDDNDLWNRYIDIYLISNPNKHLRIKIGDVIWDLTPTT